MNSLSFCNEISVITENIVDLCSTKITSLNRDEILDMYRVWNQRFSDYQASEDFNKNRVIISKEFACPDDASYLGIDFPTWINFRDLKEKRKRIMIVGIDPLRSEENPGQVSVGTPYAFHHKKMREGRTAEYWKFIERLSVEYSIYITDIYKVFFYGGPQKAARSYNNSEFVRNTLHRDILDREIEIISPNVIITMGDLATQMVLNDKNKRFKPISRFNVANSLLSLNNTHLIPMVHLSGSSRGGQKVFLETNNQKPQQGKTNGDLYFEIIKSFLDKQSAS